MLEFTPFFQAERRSIAEKLANYFNSSGLETKIYFDEVRDSYILSVPFQKLKEAKKLYQEFYFAERERIEKEATNQESINEYNESNIISDESMAEAASDSDAANDDETPLTLDETAAAAESDAPESEAETEADDNADSESSEDAAVDADADDKEAIRKLLSGSGNYVLKSEKYKDYTGTQAIFLIVGAAGFIFVILNAAGILDILSGLFANLIMGALFLFFIGVGLSTGKKARQLKKEIDEENRLTEKINEWLRTNVTEEFLSSITNPELSEELDYIRKTDTIKEMLIKEFGELDRDYLDRLIEEYYSSTFDKAGEYAEIESPENMDAVNGEDSKSSDAGESAEIDDTGDNKAPDGPEAND
ncbi:MAG: hypothetical protein GX059_01175 [Clostridiales bacterium]|nr:hypothetical protein [Clostridiales bacterium]